MQQTMTLSFQILPRRLTMIPNACPIRYQMNVKLMPTSVRTFAHSPFKSSWTHVQILSTSFTTDIQIIPISFSKYKKLFPKHEQFIPKYFQVISTLCPKYSRNVPKNDQTHFNNKSTSSPEQEFVSTKPHTKTSRFGRNQNENVFFETSRRNMGDNELV